MSVHERFIVADIGGTNARFAWVTAGELALQDITVYPCADFENFPQAFACYRDAVGLQDVKRASISLACPVEQDWVELTNNHWVFSKQTAQRELGLTQLYLLNDFAAMAYGMLCLKPEEKVLLHAGSSSLIQAPCAVVGPGTGLGVSALVPVAEGGWHAVSTEGGHISFAPQDALEMSILNELFQQYPRVSVERLLCGDGLVQLYNTMAKIFALPVVFKSAAEITTAAKSGVCDFALRVVNQFCRMLGSVVGDIVLAQGACGGVFLAGGILPRFPEILLNSDFSKAMCNKGRMSDYLSKVPVNLATADHPGLSGAAAAAKFKLTD
ncbi:MAG: glucokinase [Pseudomonadales bacterium]